MTLLAFFLLQGLHQKSVNKSHFSRRKILEMPTFLELFTERFHFPLKFHFVANKTYDKTTCSPKDCINWNLYLITWMTNLEVFTLQTVTCQWISLMMWKGCLSWKVHIPSKVLWLWHYVCIVYYCSAPLFYINWLYIMHCCSSPWSWVSVHVILLVSESTI
jgi:hypothetical protein